MPLVSPQFGLRAFLRNPLLGKLGFKKRGLPPGSFSTVDLIGDDLVLAFTKNNKTISYKVNLEGKEAEEELRQELDKILTHHNHKLVATSLGEKEVFKKIAPKLWLEDDIVSYLIKDEESKEAVTLEERLKLVSSRFDKNNIASVRVLDGNEVEITDLVTLKDYQKVTSKTDFTTLLRLVKQFKGKKLTFINATPQGGGVALMRHALIRLFRLLDADVCWYVLEPDLEVFNITKRKFHNVLQAVSPPGVELTKEDEKLYNLWSAKNAQNLKPIIKASDVIVIDDPQPCGLIPYIKKESPKTKIIYRSHIQIEAHLADQKGTPQYKTWQFLWQNIKLADAFISHPIPQFVPTVVPKDKVTYMPAVTDPLDGLNKPLNHAQLSYYLKIFNRFLKEEGQTPLDPKRPYIIQIARFDPSKGIPYVLESYLKLTQMLKGQPKPQLVITGNGSVDDPDRAPIFAQVMEIVNSKTYRHLKKDIKVVALPHIDQLLNTVLRKSKVVLQLSTKEGFEIKVTEALMKGKPIIAYRTGGIPLQIKDNVDGFLVEAANTDQVVKHLFDLFTDEKLYQNMSEAAEREYDRSLLTIPNAIRWLEISLKLLKRR